MEASKGYPESERTRGPRCSLEMIELVARGFLGPLALREKLAAEAQQG